MRLNDVNRKTKNNVQQGVDENAGRKADKNIDISPDKNVHKNNTANNNTANNKSVNGKKAKNHSANHRQSSWVFLQEFIRHPFQIGSIVPSSRYMERAILRCAAIESANTIVELGCGTCGTTRAILNAMGPQARLLSIEINPRFHALLQKINDERLIAHLGSAEKLIEIVDLYGLQPPDAIISGIPFSTMKNGVGSRIIQDITRVLAPHARFVAYQVSSRVAELSRPFLGKEKSLLEIRNIPPMRVYQWEKHP